MIGGNVRRLINETSELKRIEREIEAGSSWNEDIKHPTGVKDMGLVNSATIVSEIDDLKQFDFLTGAQDRDH